MASPPRWEELFGAALVFPALQEELPELLHSGSGPGTRSQASPPRWEELFGAACTRASSGSHRAPQFPISVLSPSPEGRASSGYCQFPAARREEHSCVLALFSPLLGKGSSSRRPFFLTLCGTSAFGRLYTYFPLCRGKGHTRHLRTFPASRRDELPLAPLLGGKGAPLRLSHRPCALSGPIAHPVSSLPRFQAGRALVCACTP